MGLVWQALGFSSEKLGEVCVGFAKFWDEEWDAKDFFCSAPTFSQLPLLPWSLFVWISSPSWCQGDKDLQLLGEGDKRISKA